MVRTKSQKFANVVFRNVQDVAEQQDRLARKYKALCKRAGGLVRNSGLLQTLAYFKAKGQKPSEKHHEKLYKHIGGELCHRDLGILPEGSDLFDYVRKSSVPEYMYLTREVLLLLNWHKRLADTLIEGTADPLTEEDT